MDEFEPSPFGTEYRPKVVRLLIYLALPTFAFSYVLTWVQNAEQWVCLLVAGVAFAGCLIAAGVYRLRGGAAAGDARWLAIILAVIAGIAEFSKN